MIPTLIERELLEKLREGWLFRVVLPCMLLGILCGLIQSWDVSERVRSASLMLSASARNSFQTPKAIFAPQPLSVFARGLDVQEGTEHIANPLTSLFHSLDFALLVEIFLSLLAVLTASVAISREWEQGTLRLILSHAVSRTHIVIAKWLSLLLLFAVILIVTLASFAATAIIMGAAPLNNGDWLRVFILFGASWLYLSVFVSAGLLFSVLGVRPSRSTAFALLFWVVVLLVVPTFGALLGKAWTKPPKRGTLLQAQGRVRMQLRLEASRGRISWPDYVKRTTEEEQRLEIDYQARVNRYVHLSRQLMRLSPAANYVFSATAIAGSGLENWLWRAGVMRAEDVPIGTVFRSTPSPAQALQAVGTELSALAIMSALLIAVSYFAFQYAAVHNA